MSDELTNTTTGFLDASELSQDEIFDEHILEEDSEVRLRIDGIVVQQGTKKDPARRMVVVTFLVDDDEEAAPIREYIQLVKAGDDKRIANRYRRRLRDFQNAFGISLDGVDIREENYGKSGLEGATGYAILGVQEADGQYEASNRIKKYVFAQAGS